MKKLALALVLLSALSVAAFAEVRGENLRVGMPLDAKNFDPQNCTDTNSYAMQKQIYQKLVELDPKTRKPYPVLAEKWEILDPQTYKFTLRKGVKFHNGEELTADDVLFTFTRLQQKENILSKHSGVYFEPNGMKVLDKYTITIRTNGVMGAFLPSLSQPFGCIMNRKAVESAGKEYYRNPIGTGPYKFVRWVKGEKVELEAFKDFWGVKPYAQKLTFVIVPDDSSRVIALETGKVDMIYGLPADEFARIGKEPKLKSVKNRGLLLLYLGMNTERPALKDARVRKALDYAINKDTYNKVVYQGYASTPAGPVPTASSIYPENPKPWPFDVEKAKQLLKEAGAKDLHLKLIVSNSQVLINGATVIQSMLAPLGITVDVQVFENALYYEKTRTGDMDLCLVTWGMQTNRDPGLYWNALYTIKAIGGTSVSRLRDKQLDDWINTFNGTLDVDKRKDLFVKMWDRIGELHPIVPMSIAEELSGGQKDLLGMDELIDGKINYLGNLHYPEQKRLQ